MRRTKEDAEETRKHLLKAAVTVFSEKGYAATRLFDIANAAGVTRGAIYWHFGNKKELLVALFKERIDPFFDIIQKVNDEPSSSVEKIRLLIKQFIIKVHEEKEFNTSQRLDFVELQIHKEFPEFHEYMESRKEKYLEIVRNIVKEGVKTGLFKPHINPEILTLTINALLAGFSMIVMHGKASINFVDYYNEIANYFLEGITNTSNDS